MRKDLLFDKRFTQIQVEAHQEAIMLYEKADKEIADADAQVFIDRTLSALRMHLQEVTRLRDMVP